MYDFNIPQLFGTQDTPQSDVAPARPSLMDRVLAKVYPSGAFGNLLPPDVLADERRMALRKAGLSLMAGAGARPLDAPPHNFGADLAQALDPSDWEQHLAGVAQTGMQLNQMMKKMHDDQAFRSMLAANPRPRTDDPKQYEQWLRRMSGLSAEAGLFDHAQVFSKMIDEVRPEKIETDLKTMKDGSTMLINKQTGETIKSWAPGEMPDLTPEQKAGLTLSYRKEFENQIGPANSQLQAYRAFKAAPWGGANDALKLANAIKIVVPSSTVTAAQVLSGQAEASFGGLGIISELLKGFSAKGELDKAGQRALEDYVEQQMPNVRANVQTLLQQHRALATGVGLDPMQTTYDPTAGEASLIPVPASDKHAYNAVTAAAKKRKKP